MAFTSHGHHIPGTNLDDTDDNQRNIRQCGGPFFCGECRQEADQVASSDLLQNGPRPQETHTDETIEKVFRALTNAVGRNLAQDCVREMQNAGILFRERVPENG